MRPALLYLITLMVTVMPSATFSAEPASPSAALPENSSAAAPAFTDAQKAAIEDVVRDLLKTKEPDLVFKALMEQRRRQEELAAAKRRDALMAEREKLFGNSVTPVGGNPNGGVTVVEFFDYQCTYCKASVDAVTQLLKTDKNVRFIYKEYPILGPESIRGSMAALASVRQGKYREFHDALMATKGHLSDDIIFMTAAETGLDVAKLKEEMADASIKKEIDANIALGGKIGVRGTPAFIFGEQLFGGAMQYKQMHEAVEDAQKKPKG